MRILALIPARGGSKRVPGKNIKPLGGLPLIAWSIRAALDSGVCSDVVVSTDDADIADVAGQYGARVPGLRPAELSTDTAGSVEVALHTLETLESGQGTVDGLLLLQPTSPFRSVETIQRAVSMFVEHRGAHPVVSVSPASDHPCRCLKSTDKGLEPFLGWDNIRKRSQDLEPAWVLNGAIYLIEPSALREKQSFLLPGTLPIAITDPVEVIDIDTPEDWTRAEEGIYSKYYKNISTLDCSVLMPNEN